MRSTVDRAGRSRGWPTITRYSSAVISPARATNDTSSTTRLPPYRLDTLRSSSINGLDTALALYVPTQCGITYAP